jgi:hypothetical protein
MGLESLQVTPSRFRLVLNGFAGFLGVPDQPRRSSLVAQKQRKCVAVGRTRHRFEARHSLPWLADLVADDATDYRSGRRSKNATAKNRTRNAAYASTNCGIFVLRAHPGTTA